jgi:DNA-binding transcriptional ArsR family regulator
MAKAPDNRPPLAIRVQAAVASIKYLADPSRLAVMLMLTDAESNVGELASMLGNRPTSLSRHLTWLRLGGLVDLRHVGQHSLYSLTPSGRAMVLAVADLGGDSLNPPGNSGSGGQRPAGAREL